MAALFAFLLYATGVSLSGGSQDQIEIARDGQDAMRAELAAESGIEFAQRRLLQDSAWQGTGPDGIGLPDGSRFVVAASLASESEYGEDVHILDVEGEYGEGKVKLGCGVRVNAGAGGGSGLALMFLGQNFTMSHGMVYGDVLLVDRAMKCDDWMFTAAGEGFYQVSHGPASDGAKIFVCTGVDGTVYKYRDDLDEYQWLGDEVVITANSLMPAWDLEEFLTPRPGQTNLVNPHNMGAQGWKLDNQYFEDTVVVVLDNNQALTLTNCHFNGGLVVISPFAEDPRLGNSNLVHVKKGTTIGGGIGGVYPHVGLIAPGGKLKSDNVANSITGFSLVKEVDLHKYSSIVGQLVILEYCKNLVDSEVTYDPEVGGNLPPFVSFGASGATTDLLGVFENYD